MLNFLFEFRQRKITRITDQSVTMSLELTKFIWLSTLYQLSKLQLRRSRLEMSTSISILHSQSTEALSMGVLLDSTLSFAPCVRRLSSKNFYRLIATDICSAE